VVLRCEDLAVNIRAATAADAGALAELGAIVQAPHHERHPDWFKPAEAVATRPFYERLLANPSVRAFVADDHGEAVGCVVTRIMSMPESPLTWESTVVYIEVIVVRPEARRKGLGRKLLEQVKSLAEEIGANRVQLMVWDFNETAERFFTAQGLEVEMKQMTTTLTTT
jgi:ribosomal protein S18 acetylase RimI-like enzyme